MVCVVHCPLTLNRTRRLSRSWSGNGSNGSRIARREDVGDTTTSTDSSGTAELGRKSGFPSAKPALGRSKPFGGENLNGAPEGVGILSVIGLNVVDPAYDMAV